MLTNRPQLTHAKHYASLLILLAASFNSNAANLCTPGETTLMSFATQAKKWLSVCRGPKDHYLVYRFGSPAKIDLQFPAKLDASSWKQFTFEGRRRGGGKQNAGFFDYSLSFTNGAASYDVYQRESSEAGTYGIGVDINAGGKNLTIKGLTTSQEGSLIGLDDSVDKLPNAADG